MIREAVVVVVVGSAAQASLPLDVKLVTAINGLPLCQEDEETCVTKQSSSCPAYTPASLGVCVYHPSLRFVYFSLSLFLFNLNFLEPPK